MATTYTKAQLIQSVRIILDQNESSSVLSSTFADPDQLQTDDIILKCLQFAIDRVLNVAPLDLLGDWVTNKFYSLTKRYSSSHTRKGKFATIDDSFIKIVSVLCTDWELPVTDILSTSDPLYRQMSSKFAGVRGHVDRPLVFLSKKPIVSSSSSVGDGPLLASVAIGGGSSVMEQLNSSSTAQNILEIFDTDKDSVYVNYVPKITVSDGMTIPDLLYQSIIYTTASLYYVTLGDKTNADMMAQEAAESMNLVKVDKQ